MEKVISFDRLPGNLEELKKLSEASFNDEYGTAALAVLTLCVFESSPSDCYEMLDYIKGPGSVSEYEKQFIRDRLCGKGYVMRSYFEGTSPENDYTPSLPYTIKISDNPYSYQNEGYATLYLTSSGADSQRQVQLRKKGEQWFVWDIFLYPDIRVPVSQDPWN